MDESLQRMDEVIERLDRIEAGLKLLIQARTVKEWYSTGEVAELVGKAEFTVREWCRFGRIHAEKRACGRGQSQEWMISHGEVQRIQNEGLLASVRRKKENPAIFGLCQESLQRRFHGHRPRR